MKMSLAAADHRRRVLPALVALLVVGAAIGCGDGQPDKTPDGRAIIRFWQFWTEPRVKAVLNQAIEEFEAANPEYKVKITDLTWNNGHQKIVAAFAAGRVPDLLELGSDWIAEFADADALLDLSSEYARLREAYVGWPPAIYREKCWALPWYLSTRVLYQNDSIARFVRAGRDRPPIVWDELLKWSAIANRFKPRFYGYGVNAAERHRLYKKFLPYLWSAGGDILTDDGTRCALDSPEAESALRFVVELSRNGIVEKQNVLDELFMSGRLLYHLSGDWLHELIQNSGVELAYSVHLMPQPAPAEGKQASFAGGEYLTIPRRATEPLGALKLARHLLSKKNIFNLCIATGCATPVNIEVGNNPYFYEDPVRRVFMQQLRLSQSPPVHPHWVAIEAELEWGIEQAQYGKLSVTDALSQTCERINRILVSPQER